VLRCDTCTTVSGFSASAESFVATHTNPNINGLFHYHFVIVNPGNKLMAEIMVTHFYDQETGRHYTHALALTGTVADMQQDYRVHVPDVGPMAIPTSVATTYTGSDQQSAVSDYLAGQLSGYSQDTTAFVYFADDTNSVYQFTDAADDTWTLVPLSGHDANGGVLDDNGDPVTVTNPSPTQTVMTPAVSTDTAQFLMEAGSGGDIVDVFGLEAVVDGVIDCLVNGCTHINGS
jgi:hypothetical protein